MLGHTRTSTLAAGAALTLLGVCCVAALTSQASAWQSSALAHQPAPLVRAAAGPPAPMASPDAPLTAAALSDALWVRLGATNGPLDTALTATASRAQAFGGDLLARLEAEEPGANVFISPLSIAAALGMAAAGTEPASPVASAFAATLRFDAARGGGPAALHALSANASELRMANSLWARAAILPSFADLVAKEFDASAAPMPRTAAPVNAWVAEATGGKIKHIIGDGVVSDPLTLALLVNAVFFKAAWEKPFDPARTVADTPFRGADGGELRCRMMAAKPQQLLFARTPAGVAVALPYVGGRFRAVLALPAEPGAAPLRALLTEKGSLGELRAALGMKQVALQLPRFRMEYGVKSLREPLRAMGLGPAFDAAGVPAFPLMTHDADAHLSDVLHKALLEVTEEGTVAAAATVAIMATRGMMIAPPPERVVFDRPFAIAIEDAEHGAPLFVGLVAAPQFEG